MEKPDFGEHAPGRFVWLPGERTHAFVPDPLPPSAIGLRPATYKKLERAAQLLGRLAAAGENLRNPYLLMRPLMRRDAIASSAIEGTFTTPRDLLLFEVKGRTGDRSNATDDLSTREVLNYVEAMEHAISSMRERPLSLRTICDAHRILLRGVRGQQHRPGEFRAVQNFIGSRNRPITEARYVPPPCLEVLPALYDLEQAFHMQGDVDYPELVWLAMIHYQFEAIHPFGDGNGRIGRLLIPLLLCTWKHLPPQLPLLYISPYFLRNREQYEAGLLEVSRCGAWGAWVDFFLDGVTEEAASAWRRASNIRTLRHQYHRRFGSGMGKVPITAIDLLFERPAVQVKDVAEAAGVTPQTANSYVARLVDEGVLAQADEARKWGRTFVAGEILNLLYAEDPPNANEDTPLAR